MRRRFEIARSSLIALLVAGFTYSSSVPASVFTHADDDRATHADYPDFRPKTIVVTIRTDSRAIRNAISKRLKIELEKRRIEVYLYHELFSATQNWDEDRRWTVYESLSVEAELVVGVNTSNASIIANGRRTTLNYNGATTQGNRPSDRYGHSNGQRSGDSSRRHAESTRTLYGIVLFDLAQNRAAWTSSIITDANGGRRNYKPSSKAAAKRIIRDLIRDNHIPKK